MRCDRVYVFVCDWGRHGGGWWICTQTNTHTHIFDVDVCAFSPFVRFARSDKTFYAHAGSKVQTPLPPLFTTAPLYMRCHFRVATTAATRVGPMIDFHNARALYLIN